MNRNTQLDNYLNEIYPIYEIGILKFEPADILFELDPIAYQNMVAEMGFTEEKQYEECAYCRKEFEKKLMYEDEDNDPVCEECWRRNVAVECPVCWNIVAPSDINNDFITLNNRIFVTVKNPFYITDGFSNRFFKHSIKFVEKTGDEIENAIGICNECIEELNLQEKAEKWKLN